MLCLKWTLDPAWYHMLLPSPYLWFLSPLNTRHSSPSLRDGVLLPCFPKHVSLFVYESVVLLVQLEAVMQIRAGPWGWQGTSLATGSLPHSASVNHLIALTPCQIVVYGYSVPFPWRAWIFSVSKDPFLGNVNKKMYKTHTFSALWRLSF